MLLAVEPKMAKSMIERGALLVDVREIGEFKRERIPRALNRPLSSLSKVDSGAAREVIFLCRTGSRTNMYLQRLASAVDCPGYVLRGGLEAWKKAGLEIEVDSNSPSLLGRLVAQFWRGRSRTGKSAQ
jgi:rhodanese-related sulfurtransferase